MNSEILCIGTELLLGDTTNTNVQYIAQKFTGLGIDCFYQSVVGDNIERIKSSLRTAFNRADLVVITGGLGPTDDDVTMRAVAEYLEKELVFNEESYIKISGFFEKRGYHIPEKAKKQACFPEGAEVIPNPAGTAPGMIYKDKDKILIVLPGVPDELYTMWDETVHPYLEKFSEYVLEKRFLKFFGIPEGALGEKISDLMESSNPTVAPLVADGQPNVRIAAKAKTRSEAQNLIYKMEKKILERAGEFYWGADDDTLEQVVGQMLLENELIVATAESCTGGLVSSKLTDVSGSSSYIMLNFTTYSNEAKSEILGVAPSLIEEHGAVSEQVARAMAEGVRRASKTDIGLGITGIAGPTGGSAEKPVGLVYIGISDSTRTEVHRVNINPAFNRIKIKQRACQHALNYLRLFIM